MNLSSRTLHRLLLVAVISWLGWGTSLTAVADADIRFATSEPGPFWAGQAVELHLELWSDGFSFADQLFSLPEIQGAFLVQADAGTPLVERLGDTRRIVAEAGNNAQAGYYYTSAH